VNEKYAFFIWASYAATAAVLLWNWFAPRLARNQLRGRLSDAAQDDETDS